LLVLLALVRAKAVGAISVLGTDGFEGLQGFFYVLLYLNLGGEDVPNRTLLVYDVGTSTREQTEFIGNTVEPPNLATLVAEYRARQ
jgi:hypothetical protein